MGFYHIFGDKWGKMAGKLTCETFSSYTEFGDAKEYKDFKKFF